MSMLGDTSRMHDMHAAIIDARGRRARLKTPLGRTAKDNGR